MNKLINEVEVVLELGFDKIAEYGERYKQYYLGDLLKEKGLTKNSILENWCHSFKFFCDRCFYQGRRDEVSKVFEKITIETLEKFLGKSISEKEKKIVNLEYNRHLNLSQFGRKDDGKIKHKLKEIYDELIKTNPILQVLERGFDEKGYKGKINDRLMVLHLLVLNSKLKGETLVDHFKLLIERGAIEEAYNELINITSIKDKIASLLLRDIVLLYDLENKVLEVDQVFIQPIDTWLNKISLAMMNKKLKELKISAAKFNAGAWFYSKKILKT